jgi:hypothetical protein
MLTDIFIGSFPKSNSHSSASSFTEPVGLLPYLQELAIDLYSESHESSPHPNILFLSELQ